ncbi:hypothetical protein HID58_049036, partial [Brassica napus]
SRTTPRFDDFVLSTLPFMFPHLVAAFIAACVSVTFSFAMFATPGLDNVLLRSLGDLVPSIPSFVVLHRHRRLVCACLVCEVLLTS